MGWSRPAIPLSAPWAYRAWLAVQSLALTVILTWPVAFRPNAAVLGSPDADTMKHLWTLWWIRRVVAFDRGFPFHTDYLNFPVGMDLWPVEPLNGLLAVFLWPLPLVVVANGLALANLTLDGLCGALLGREASGSPWGGIVGGFLLQTSSFALFTLHVGVGELQHLWVLPLGLTLGLRLVRTGLWRWALATGAALAFAVIACFYHGFFLALGLLVLGAWAVLVGEGPAERGPVRRRLALASRLAVAALLAAAVAVPWSRAFSTSYGLDTRPPVSLPDYVLKAGYGQPVTDPVSARLQPEDLVWSPSWTDASRDLRAYGGGRLLGLPLLVLAAVGLWRRPRQALPLLAMGALGVLLALGSYLSIGGEEWTRGGTRYQLPFLYLNRALAFVGEPINFPVRFLALTSVALAAVGAAALAPGGRSRAWSLALGALALANGVDVGVRQLLPWPMPSFSLPDLGFLVPLADHPRHGLVDLSVAWRSDRESRFQVMAAQMVHQHPVQAVPLERLEYFVRDGALLLASLKLVEDLEPAWQRKPVPLVRDYRGDLHLLAERGFSEAMVTWQGGRGEIPSELTNGLEAIFGTPLLEAGATVVYRIPAVEATPEEKDAWREEYRLRLDAARKADATIGPQR